MRTGNRDLIKQINQSITLNLVRSNGPLSRTHVARLSGLSLATVSALTSDLLDQELIEEVGAGASTGGRRPVMLKLNARGGFVVGLKLTEDAITCALTDLAANVLYSRVTAVAGSRDPAVVITAIIAAVEATLAESQVALGKVMGIGIGLAGVIDSQAGICRYSPIMGWRDVAIGPPLTAHFRLPVYIENDVNTLTIAEQWFGTGRGVEHFLVATVGRGIGLGIIVNGQLYRGVHGSAGEFEIGRAHV